MLDLTKKRKRKEESKLMEDTIAAISTAQGIGAISIIRISGSDAITITQKIWKGPDLLNIESHTITYGYIIENNKIIDEVLITIMKSPKTFTKEDIVEINTHGGIATTNKVLELLLRNGCRLAHPGEFTKRAFLNGRIDLLEAEGIIDLINAKTDKARQQAIAQITGKATNMIQKLRNYLKEIIANIEVNIDYPEYEDIEIVTHTLLKEKLSNLENEIIEILKESENGKLMKEGITTSIIGKPNVGKSSLLNKLIEEEKAIVTDIEGTTRDIVEGTLIMEGIIFNIIDTAGIRQTEDIVEKLGVEKSLELINKSQLVLFVLNNNEEMTKEEIQILNTLESKNYLIIINKVDLENKLNYELFDPEKIVKISALNNQGIEQLKEKIIQLFHLEQIETEDISYLTNARSIALLKNVLEKVKDIETGLEKEIPIDMIEIDIKEIWNLLGEITGETYQDELIDQLFSQFCLGK